MAAPERWWVVGAAAPHQPLRWKIVESPAQPIGDFIKGPYTKEQAQDELKKLTSPITPPKLPKIPNPFSPLSDIGKIGHWIGDAVLHIVDGAMWRSIGWLALGLLLVFSGIYLWFRTSATYKDLQSAITGTVKAL